MHAKCLLALVDSYMVIERFMGLLILESLPIAMAESVTHTYSNYSLFVLPI